MKLRPEISELIEAASARHGVSPVAMKAIALLESGGDPKAKNPRSSAGGLFQFIDRTANDVGLADRFDAAQASDSGAFLGSRNAASLRRALGREPTTGELYLAHQQGADGAVRLLRDPSRRAVDLVGADAVRLNMPAAELEKRGGVENVTAGDFAALWTGKAEKVAAGLGGSGGGQDRVAPARAVRHDRAAPAPVAAPNAGFVSNDAFLAALEAVDRPEPGRAAAPANDLFAALGAMPGLRPRGGLLG